MGILVIFQHDNASDYLLLSSSLYPLKFRTTLVTALAAFFVHFLSYTALAQDSLVVESVNFTGEAELMGWGNLEGIRLDGELFPFRTSIEVIREHWDDYEATGQHQRRQRPVFEREDSIRTVRGRIDPLTFVETVETIGNGVADLDVEIEATADTSFAGVYLMFEIVASDYADGSFGFIGTDIENDADIAINYDSADVGKDYVRAAATGLRFGSFDRKLEVAFETPTGVIVRDHTTETGQYVLRAYVTLFTGDISAGHIESNRFRMQVTGVVDVEPVRVELDVTKPGRAFHGLGGNFRLQNPRLDPAVIKYNLDSLNVTWGRVELPWRQWHPTEDMDPLALAAADSLNPRVEGAMRMARTLVRQGHPVIVTAWFPPDWSVNFDADTVSSVTGRRLYGKALDSTKVDKIVQSIGDYLGFMKQRYGVEASLFSFNQPDLGIDVRQTADEHAAFIKQLGEHLADRGLSTKLLLGDVSTVAATEYVKPTILDRDARQYVGALSFHSWSGASDMALQYWRDAANLLNVPLLVGEASTDASAYLYPEIFSESSYALNEIFLYTRILAITQPMTIVQWQLTSDYSILRGGGLYGNEDEPLTPTQRFWNLKQLSRTPKGAFWLPTSCNNTYVACAAFGDIANQDYAIHIANSGAAREVLLQGLPASIQSMDVLLTDQHHAMAEVQSLVPEDGQARFKLPATSFVTILAN